MVYKNTIAVNKKQFFLPVVTRLLRRHAEVKDRMPQLHDAAASAQCHGGTLMRATLKNQPPSKPQLWLLRAASRLRKRHCVVKNQGLHFSEAKRPGREASSSSDIENECHYTTSSSYNFKACRGANSLLHVILSYWILSSSEYHIQYERKRST